MTEPLTHHRISSGIPGLDTVLLGGLIEHQSYLLVGPAGTGKTLCSLQWLLDGVEKGERGLFITLAEPIENIERNVRSFGWSLDGLQVADLNPTTEGPSESLEDYEVFPPSEVERGPLWEGIYEAVEELEPDRVVIDSVTQLHYLSTDDYQFRKQLLALVTYLRRQRCTTLLTFEPSQLDREVSVALVVDGIFRLRMQVSPNRMTGLRSIQVQKLRGSGFLSGMHPLRITDNGIRVFPHHIEETGDTTPSKDRLPSGIDNLDRLIGGGLEPGTATILSGPCGAGKSTLGMQFLTQAAASGTRAVCYTFEEAPGSIIARTDTLGLPVKQQIESGMLEIVRVNPMEFYPDEFLGLVRRAVDEDERRAVMIDSLRGYELAMEEYGSLVANIQNMVTYLNRHRVSTILVNEVEQITGNLMPTEVGISYIADSVILLRYAESAGRVIKVIACLKKRYGPLDPALCELEITSDGLKVGRELKEMRNILSGSPSTVPSSTEG